LGFGPPGLRPGELYPVLPGPWGPFGGALLGLFFGSFRPVFGVVLGAPLGPYGPLWPLPALKPVSPPPGLFGLWWFPVSRFFGLFSPVFGWFLACFPGFSAFGRKVPQWALWASPALGPFWPGFSSFSACFGSGFGAFGPDPGALVPVCWAEGPAPLLGPQNGALLACFCLFLGPFGPQLRVFGFTARSAGALFSGLVWAPFSGVFGSLLGPSGRPPPFWLSQGLGLPWFSRFSALFGPFSGPLASGPRFSALQQGRLGGLLPFLGPSGGASRAPPEVAVPWLLGPRRGPKCTMGAPLGPRRGPKGAKTGPGGPGFGPFGP